MPRNADLMRRRQRGLNKIVERGVPGVYRHPDLDQKPGDENNQRGAEDRPVLPAVGAVNKPKEGENAHAEYVERVEHQIVERPEARRADRHILRCPGDPQQPVAAARLPKDHRQQRPDKGRNKKRPRFGEKGFKHHALLLTSFSFCCAVYHKDARRKAVAAKQSGRMMRPDISSLVRRPSVQNCFCRFHL